MANKKVIRWSLSLALILLAIGIGIIYLVRTRPLHNYVLAKIIQKTQEATGGRVEIADYDFHWFGFRADVYQMAIHGTESDPEAPLFAADRLSIGLKIISVLRGKVDLNEVVIDRPVIHFLVGEDGTTNIPRPEVPEKDRKPVNIFDLAVKQFQIERGELYYNDRRTPFSAELHDLQTEIQFNILTNTYEGSLRYHRGLLQYTNFNPFEHNLEATFLASRSGLEVERFLVSTALSEILFRGNLADYGNPTVEGTFDATISTQELRSILKQASLPLGQITTNGSLHYQKTSDQTRFLDDLLIDGHLNSPMLALRLPQVSSDFREFQGHYRLEKGNLVVDGLQTNLLGGELRGEFTMRHLAENSESRLKASLRSISLDAVRNALAQKPPDGMPPISGDLNGTIEASWRGSMENLQLGSDAVIRASTPLPTAGAGNKTTTIPVNGVAHLRYDGARKTLSVNQSYLRTPHTQIRIHGIASERSSIRIEANSSDLHELDLLALSFRNASANKSQPTRTPEPLGLRGTATLNGQIQGPTEALRFVGQLTVNHLQLRREQVRLLRTEFEISPSSVALHNGYLETIAQSRIRFDFSAGLQDWDYSSSQPITIQASTRKFPMSELEHLLGLNYPVTGALTADISIRGSQLLPEGQASLQLTEATLWEQPVEGLSVEVRGNGDSLHSMVALQMTAGKATGNLTYYPQNERYEVQIEAKDIQLEDVEAIRASNLDMAGSLTLSGQGQGTLRAPQLEVTARIPQLQMREQTMTDVNAQVRVAEKHANLILNSKVEDGELQATAGIALTRDYDTTAKLDARSLPLGIVLAKYLPRMSEFLGQTEIHASLKGPLKNPARLEAQIEIPTLTMSHQGIQIANVKPIRLDYRNEVFTLQRVQIKGTGTDLEFEGTANLRGEGRLNGSARGTLDLQIVQILRPEMETSGQVKLDVRAQGNKTRPNIQGEVRIIDATFQSPGAPLGAEELNGELSLSNNRILINQLSGHSGGGTLSASGSVTLESKMQFNLGLTANGVRLRYPYGVRTVLNSQLAMTGDTEAAVLSGRMLVDRLSFTRDFDLASFIDQFRGTSSPPPSEGFQQNLRLNVAIIATEALGLESAKLSIQGTGNLSLRGTAAQPVLLGRANLTGGEVFFLGHRYEVQQGVINFTNPFRTEPVVNLAVRTRVNQYDLNMTFIGPVDNLRTAYTSDPPLPPVDIINLLAFGKIATAGDGAASTPPSLGAQSVLAKGLSSQVSGQIERLAGLSHLSIDPTLGGNQQNLGARLAIQQRVTSKLLFTFATDVTSTQGERIQLEYQVNRGLSITGTRDENGGYAADIKRRKTF
ncbi:MAG: translocation/assembly module TamB domain-containing protein [Acidobacteria bacterium]|nr:translocation/assembly module TamB domain-containing protein [Acidobacteriota bacterium]